MKCSEFERWLDEGEPEHGREQALRHAAECTVCGPALQAARAVDAALRLELAGPSMTASPGFVASVMHRVDEAARARAAISTERSPLPWWAALATDPVSMVSVTLGISLAVLAILHPRWLVNVGVDLSARWWLLAESISSATEVALDPTAWLSIGIALAPLAAWGLIALYRRVERAIILIAERPGR